VISRFAILDWQDLFFIILRLIFWQNMLLQDGTGPPNFYWALNNTQLQWICGVLDASLLRCSRENLSFLEQILRIKLNLFVSTWGLLMFSKWNIFHRRARVWLKICLKIKKMEKILANYFHLQPLKPLTYWKNFWCLIQKRE